MSLFRILTLTLLSLCFQYTYAQVADFSMNTSGGCAPLTVTFSNLSSGISPNARFEWDFGNGNRSVLKTPSAIFLDEKTYNVTLTVIDGTQTSTKTKTVTVYKKPTADFSVADSIICIPESAQFISSSTAGDGSITTYDWDFGNGYIQQGYSSTMSYYYNLPGTATVSLTVRNSHGCQSTKTKLNVIKILPRIEPQFTANKTLLCSLDDSVKFTNSSTGPGTLQYLWDFGDGRTSTALNPAHKYNTKGLYQVKLTVTNEVGCSATSYPTQVNAAYFNTDFTSRILCREATFSYTSYLYPSNTVWQFTTGGPQTTGWNPVHIYPTAGTYNVTLINTYGVCKDTVTKPVTVFETVNFNSGITMPASICRNNSASFTSTSNTPPSLIKWDFGDGYTTTTGWTNMTHYYNTPGTYTVKMTNVFGTCSETITKTLVVNDIPNPQGFLVNYGGACGAPVTVTFTDTTTGAVSWRWSLDYSSNAFSTSKTATYSFTSNGYHTVHLTVTNAAGCSMTTQKSVNIFPPSANIIYTQTSSPRGSYDCDSLRIRFAVNANQTIQSYSWNLGNGNTSTSPTPEGFYSSVGVYPVTLNYVTESGCAATASYSVRVYGKPQANFNYSVPCGNSLTLQFNDISPFSDNWQWKFPNGYNAYNSTAFYTFPDTGKYQVTFINSIGHCNDTIVKTVHANLLPSGVNITKAETTCQGTRGLVKFDQYSLRASGGTWDFGDGTVIPYDSSAHNVQHTYTASGTYTVRLTSKYGNCTYTSTQTVRILLKQSPTLAANKTQMCASDQLTINVGGLQTNPYTGSQQWGQYYVQAIQYNTGATYNGYIDNGNWNYTTWSGTLSNFPTGVTSFRAIITNYHSGCSDTTNWVNIQVNGPKVGFVVPGNLCFKSTFVFTDTSKSQTSTPLTNWTWNFGDGNSKVNPTNAPVQHRYNNPGQYQVSLRVTDATGCAGIFYATVNAVGTKAAFTPSGLFIPNVPLNTTVTFYNNSNNHLSNPVYSWNYGNGNTSVGYTGSQTYPNPGVNTVQLIATDASIPCADTASTIITVKDFNTAFRFSTSFLGTSSCPPVVVRINNLSVGYVTLKWDFGDGTTSTSANYPSHIYENPGKYKITLYTYGYNGLTGTYVDSIEVKTPAAAISADVLKGCLSQNVSFQSSTVNTSSYTWDMGDGVVKTGNAAANHSYSYPGVYTPRLIAKNDDGCPAAARLPEPVVIDSLSAEIKGIPALICDSALIQFDPAIYSFAETALGTPLKYKWEFGTGNSADTSNIRRPAFRYLSPGTYTVKLTVTSPYGCMKQATATFEVKQKAKGRITAVPEICEQGSVQFTGTATPNTSVQWRWEFDNGNIATLQNPPSQVYNTPGDYEILLIVNREGCIDTARHQLKVNAKPAVNALPAKHVLCLGSTVDLSAQGGITYSWTPATGLSNANIANPIASPTTNTKYTVTVTTDKGCVDKGEVDITVAHPIDVQLKDAADLCKGGQLLLNATGATTYQWINNVSGLSSTTAGSPMAAPGATITYTVVGYDQYNCFTDTASITVNVRALPTVNAGPDAQVPGNTPYQINATGSGDITTWTWTPASVLSCTNCPAPVATIKMDTEIKVEVATQYGCKASDAILLKVDCTPNQVHIPNAFTPNHDGKNDKFYVLGSGVKIIRFFRIYNRWGEIIFEKTNIPIADAAYGWDGYYNNQMMGTGNYVYLAEFECGSGAIFTRTGSVMLIR